MKQNTLFKLIKNQILIILLITALSACGSTHNGSGDLTFDIHYINVGHQTASVFIFDQDADGNLDLATTGGSSLTILRGDGSGNFYVHEKVPAGEHPVDLEAGDLDHDGWLDLVIVNHETNYLTLLFGDKGGFTSGKQERLIIDVKPHPHAVALADLDEDGNLDIIADDRDRERLKVFKGEGDGSFEQGAPISVGGDPYRGMSFADINDDGHQDVITPNPLSIAIQTGNGTGSFSHLKRIASASAPPFNTSVADFTGDNVPDIAAGSGEGRGLLMVWLGTKNGNFERAANAPFTIARGPTRLNAADINDDGTDDILIASYLGNEVAIALWDEADFRVVRIKLDDNPWDIAADDLNGDGRPDLVVAHDGGTKLTVMIARD